MKKSVIAMAVLGAFAGTAAAQSSLTIYGIIDQGVSRLDDGQSYIGTPADQIGQPDDWTVKSATSSRLGFRGTEDLGSGLKANFQLEHRFSPDTGTEEVAGRFWQGSSWVGLSSARWGEVRLGRDYTPTFFPALAGDPWGYDYNVAGFSGFTRAGNVAGSPSPVRGANQLSYKTPNLGGFTAMLAVGAGEGTAGRTLGANVIYSAGPLYAGLALNDIQGPVDNRVAVLTAAYDFGFVRPSLTYARADNPNAVGAAVPTDALRADSWIIGATAPLGQGILKLGYGVLDNPAGNPAGAATPTPAAAAETKKFGLGYQYNLSKRTSVHADIGTAKSDGFSRTTGIEVGFKHVF